MKRTGTLTKRNGVYHLRYMIEGCVFQASLKTKNKGEAETSKEVFMRNRQSGLDQYERFLISELQRLRSFRDGVMREDVTLIDAWDLFLKSPKRPRCGKLAIGAYKSALGGFIDGLPSCRKKVAEVTEHDAHRHMEAMERNGASLNTARKHLAYLKVIFSVLLPGDAQNPFKDAVARGDSTVEACRPLTTAQLSEVMLIASQSENREVYGLFMLLAYSGLRLNDAAMLKAEDIDLQRGIIQTVPSKTSRYGRHARIGLHPALRFALKEFSAGRTGGFVLPAIADMTPIGRTQAVKKVFAMTNWQQTIQRASGRSQTLYGASSFRHTMEDRLRVSGVNQVVINTILCHQDKSMAGTYATVSDKELIDAVLGAFPDLRPKAKSSVISAAV